MIELFESISALQKRKGLGNPARQDIVMVLQVPLLRARVRLGLGLGLGFS